MTPEEHSNAIENQWRQDEKRRRTIYDAVAVALDHLDVTAHNPVQGMAMHKVIGESVLQALDLTGDDE